MRYFSLNGSASPVDFRTATILGQAPDKGLYFPEEIPVWDSRFFNNEEGRPATALAFEMIRPYVGGTIPDEVLASIVNETLNFPIPLVRLNEAVYTLEMFHGRTLAFKDIGARFMSRCLGYFVKDIPQKVTVLVATSGDTGGAVADGFYGVEGVEVVILFPKGKVSTVQRKQLTTLGNNIRAIEVNGNFDDCQRLVKQAFADEALTKNMFLTSANSINVARWLPQQFFYLMAWLQWEDKAHPPVVSVPSGNFGNICAGLLCRKSGLPIKHFLAACNANKTVPDFFTNGVYEPRLAIPTISNAMDVGDPSNFIRIRQLFQDDQQLLKEVMTAYSFTDEETKSAIQELYNAYQYHADPHGAVGYLALKDYLQAHPAEKGIFAETAHPVKFFDVSSQIINEPMQVPEAIQDIMDLPEKSISIEPQYLMLKSVLLS